MIWSIHKLSLHRLCPFAHHHEFVQLDAPGNRSRGEQRSSRREKLYAVVRESMTRAGVLTTGYKFKVLSLDSQGRQFIVMVDLASERAAGTAHLGKLEAAIVRAARRATASVSRRSTGVRTRKAHRSATPRKGPPVVLLGSLRWRLRAGRIPRGRDSRASPRWSMAPDRIARRVTRCCSRGSRTPRTPACRWGEPSTGS